MIYCGRFTTGQIIKILGVFQLIGAIIITSVGISIVVDFISIHHVKEHNSEIADSYVDMHWTVTYGAAIWMGLIMAIAGIFGCFADVKPHKSKYVYGTLIINFIVVIASILLVVFSYDAIKWFDTCQYKYHVTTSPLIKIRNCTDNDKSKGIKMYWTELAVTLLVIPLTVAMIITIIITNRVLFQHGFGGNSFRSLVYKFKGNGNSMSIKTKNTHEFDKEMNLSEMKNHQEQVHS